MRIIGRLRSLFRPSLNHRRVQFRASRLERHRHQSPATSRRSLPVYRQPLNNISATSTLTFRFHRSIVKMAAPSATQAFSTTAGSNSASSSGAQPKTELTNRLDESRSPYVRGHKDNPVAWQMWNDETLELAKKSQRLIFLSVGYSSCHCECLSVLSTHRLVMRQDAIDRTP